MAVTTITTMNREMSIFCDGACRGNGQRGAVGGWAWAYWNGSARGEPVEWAAARLATPSGQAATNQRAELTALLEALRWWSASQPTTPITIYTDSMYAINCTSKWGPSWRKAGWKRAGGEPLQNLDIIKPLVDIWKPLWRLVHVRGHQTGSGPEVWGNNWVDRAAVEGASGTVHVASPVQHWDVISYADDDYAPPVTEEKPKPTAKPNPTPTVKRTTPIPSLATVRQSDIRMWFGAKE